MRKILGLVAVACLAVSIGVGNAACSSSSTGGSGGGGGSGGSGGSAGTGGGTGGATTQTFKGVVLSHPLEAAVGGNTTPMPVAGATVNLFSAVALLSGGTPINSTPVTTGTDGSFSFDNVALAKITLGAVVGVSGTGLVQSFQGICSMPPTTNVNCTSGTPASTQVFSVSTALNDAVNAVAGGGTTAFDNGYLLGEVVDPTTKAAIAGATVTAMTGTGTNPTVEYLSPNGTGGLMTGGTATDATGAYLVKNPGTQASTATFTGTSGTKMETQAGGWKPGSAFLQFLQPK